MCTDRVIRDTYATSPCEKHWQCQNKEEKQATKKPREGGELNRLELFPEVSKSNEGISVFPQTFLITRLKRILLKDEQPDRKYK